MSNLHDVHLQVAGHLEEISELFKPGCKMTFVMRCPGDTETEMVVSDDELGPVIQVLRRSMARDEQRLKA